MKKLLTSLICFLASFVSLSFVMPIQGFVKADEGATQEPAPITYDLISPNFFTNQEEVLEKYNIVDYDNQSPFDVETGQKLGGYSFMFNKDQTNQIVGDQYVKVNEISLSAQNDYCFIVWIYFNSVYLHDLSITLVLENGASLTWRYTQSQLMAMLAKYTDLVYATNGVPYAWNKFTLPFSSASKVGEMINGDSYYKIEKMVVNFTQSVEGSILPEGESYSVLRFYNPSVLQTEEPKFSIEKQEYFFSDFNTFDQEYINSLIKGDKIYIPNKNDAVKFAWAGFEDLKNSPRSTLVWMITITDPDSEKKSMSFATDTTPYTFEEVGTYIISYQCVDTTISNTKAIISYSQKIIVKDMNAIRLDLPDRKLEVGKTYKIKAYTSSLFNSTQNLIFTSASDKMTVTQDDQGYIYITVNEKGNYTLNASVEGTRTAAPTMKQYTSTFTIQSYEQGADTSKIIFIIGAVILGIILIVGVVMFIKAIIQDRKGSVR